MAPVDLAETIVARGTLGRGAVEVCVDSLSDQEWDRTFAAFDDLHYEQMAAYCKVQWGGKRSSSLLLRRDGEVVAGARVVLLSIPSLGKGIAWVRFGPQWRRKNREVEPELLEAILLALREEYCARRGLLLAILPRPDPDYGKMVQDTLTELGFVDHKRYDDWDHYLVNLTLGEKAQLANMSRHWRRSLRKTEDYNLDIRFVEDEEGFRTFETLHDSMVTRKNASRTGPIHLLYGMRAAFPSDVLKLVLVSHQGKPVAGAVFAVLGDTAYYILGATSDDALPLSAGLAMQWWIVRWLSQHKGLRWYDIGGTAGQKGLRVFKSGLTGREGRIVPVPGEFQTWDNAGDRMIGNAMFALRPLYRKMSAMGLVSGQK